MPIKNLKFIFPILALGVAVTVFVFFGMNRVQAVTTLNSSWLQTTDSFSQDGFNFSNNVC